MRQMHLWRIVDEDENAWRVATVHNNEVDARIVFHETFGEHIEIIEVERTCYIHAVESKNPLR